MPSLYVKLRNSLSPGFSACSKCGGNWGWKKYVVHPTTREGHSGLFLFCRECDPRVTPEERWKALDEWKETCLRQLTYPLKLVGEELEEQRQYILDREFTEFPRS